MEGQCNNERSPLGAKFVVRGKRCRSLRHEMTALTWFMGGIACPAPVQYVALVIHRQPLLINDQSIFAWGPWPTDEQADHQRHRRLTTIGTASHLFVDPTHSTPDP